MYSIFSLRLFVVTLNLTYHDLARYIVVVPVSTGFTKSGTKSKLLQIVSQSATDELVVHADVARSLLCGINSTVRYSQCRLQLLHFISKNVPLSVAIITK